MILNDFRYKKYLICEIMSCDVKDGTILNEVQYFKNLNYTWADAPNVTIRYGYDINESVGINLICPVNTNFSSTNFSSLFVI